MKKKIAGIFPVVLFLITIFIMSSSVAYARTALKITKQPVSITVSSGTTAKVTVSATGDGLKYKWYYKNAGDKKYSLTKTFTGNSYSVKMNSSRSGRKIYCVVTDKYGSSVKTNSVTLSKGTTLKITKQPISVTVSSGSTAKVTVSATGDGLKYKWYYKNAGDKKYSRTTTFTGKSYSVKMNDSRSGRKIYCVITDKYGSSVKTNTVTLSEGTTLKITKQPVSVSANCGKTAKVTVTATGDGLKYKWYYKNAGDKKYSRTTAFTGKSYSVKMNDSRSGRKIYCVITDKYGSSVQTKTVTLSAVHTYDKGVVSRKATCSLPGEKVFTCKSCSHKVIETISKTAHSMGAWKVMREATVTGEGFERRTCKKCSYYNDRTIEKLKPVYYITANTGAGQASKVGVAANGKYALTDPEKAGYTFMGWKDEKGNTFSSSGTVKANVTVNAVWEIDGTDTQAELIERTNAGVDRIVITKDITVNQPVFISYNTTIYADGDYTLKRAPGYAGDIFVVGQDQNGKSAVVLGRKAVLTLGGGKGTLTIDGNKDNLTVKVVGSAVFVSDSATLNIYDGVKIVNNMKLGNDRVLKYIESLGSTSLDRAGGAAVLNLNATVNMYGGVMNNNTVATEYTITTDETGAQVSNETNGCGGSVYNRGNFNMYGGIISGSEALRGGGIYNDRIANLSAGTVSDNLSHTYGGGVSSSSGSNADMHIGSEGDGATMIFIGNHSKKAGGALYSNTSSPIIIYGNTEIVNNRTDSSGGAIYTAGPLTVNDTYFAENTCEYSGGAIYHHYTKPDFDRRLLTLTNCVFEGNSGNLGGAVILSASDAVAETNLGTYATITDCKFIKNQAVTTSSSAGNPNGGAIYITRKSEVDIEGCTFEENSAANNAGAIAAQNNTRVKLADCDFIKNTAVTGGAVSAAAGSVLNMTDIEFNGNNAILSSNNSGGLGGALYIYDAAVTVKNVDLYNNTAAVNAGAIYLSACELTMDSTCEFDSNTAGEHGGAVYMTYKTVDGVKNGSKLNADDVAFKNNSAKAGGAISIRSACEANLDGAVLTHNSVSGTGNDASGGGAVYVGYGTLTLTDVTATGNTSAGYGGAVNSVASTVTVSGGSFSSNAASSGGAFNAISKSALSFSGTTLSENKSTYIQSGEYDSSLGGGAVNISGGSLTVSDVVMDKNTSGYYGGAVLTSKATVKIDGNSEVTNSVGATGAALYFSGASEVTMENVNVSDNISSGNGVIYANGCTFNATNVTATGNTANSGGVIYTSGGSTKVNVYNSSWSDNEAKNGGAIYLKGANVNLTDSELNGNSASTGGAIYTQDGTLAFNSTVLSENEANGNGGAVYAKYTVVTLDGSTFTSNKASSNGGALDIVGADVTATGANKFSNNTAAGHGGAVYVVYQKDTVTKTDESGNETSTEVTTVGKLNMTNGSFENNSAMGGGAISIRTGCEVTLDGTILNGNSVTGYDDKNYGAVDDGDGEGGGAIYVGYGKLTLNNVTAAGNTASGFGGAVDAVKATVEVNGGIFKNNIASTGGAFNSISGSDISFNGTNLSENESTYVQTGEYNSALGGGAVKISGGSLSIKDTTLDSNKAGYYGGAVLASGVEVTVEGNTVIKGSEGATGAALHFSSKSTVTMTDTEIINNVSTNNGVVYANNCTVDMNNVTASENKAVRGGVIYTSNSNTKITLNAVAFSGNTASSNGGVIFAENANIKLVNGTYSGNSASGGGVIYSQKAPVTVEGAVFTGNSASSNGGAVVLAGASMTSTGDTVFENNTSVSHAGAVYVTYYTNDDETRNNGLLTMTGGSFNNNKSMGGGAVSIRTGGEAIFDGTTFKSNSVEGYDNENDGDGEGGGAIYVGYGKLTLNNVSATGNTASNFGGVIDAAGGDVTIKDGIFSGNTAGSGGVVYAISNSSVTVEGGTIEKNIVTGTGGAINIRYGTLDMKDTVLSENEATSTGGAVYAYRNTVTLNGVEFISNKTASNGGAVNIVGAEVTATGDCVFRNNSATGHGGAIYVTYVGSGDSRVPGVLTMTDGLFEANSAMAGGAVSIRTACAAELNGTKLIKNSVSGYADKNDGDGDGGGAIYVGFGSVTLNNVTATENKAAETTVTDSTGAEITALGFGGVVDAVKSTVTVTGGTFSGNEATYGGVIHALNYCTVTVTGSNFSSNKATTGGAVYLDQGSTATINDSTLDGNSATGGDGGAIVVADTSDKGTSATTLNMTKVTLQNNTASAKGGAISTDTSSSNLVIDAENCTFSGNSSTGAGAGAVEIQNGNCNSTTDPTVLKLVFKNCSFTGNNAKTTGGAVEIRSSSCAKFDGITATGNTAKGNGGAIYVTSNNSRVYLTGEVNQGDNTSTGGKFIHLYNNKDGYANPPKLYTTYSSNAEWYTTDLVNSDYGHDVAVAFDLTTMP